MATALPAALIEHLSVVLGAEGWRMDEAARAAHASDDSRRVALPDAVALPTTREQIVVLVRACREHRVPLVARGAGTATTGAAVPVHGGIVVAFARMNRILDIRAADRCAVVEPGVLNGDLQQALQAQGLFWPPDPSSAANCSIGGNLATHSATSVGQTSTSQPAGRLKRIRSR